ncbi:RDD family protein [Collimonas arenae]|uniref:RDD family protein n=1 Tax=Collimonas arenae TaxID=279058 RepID=A0A127QDI2_9BURK|nr:RDD family protein [Collimonas arenae]AMO98176.1 RDD family protein [Collimonas arenae]AMP08046.1 RDD family protein [Collimonas arenae]
MDDTNQLEYVGFWLRVWASIIDTVLVLAITTPLLLAIYGRERLAAGITFSGFANFLISYVFPAVAVLLFWSFRQATPGKMAISARIVDARTGGPTSVGQNIIRYLGYFPSTFVFCLGLIWVGLDKRKQGWHDKLAGTVVVRPKRGNVEPVRFEA